MTERQASGRYEMRRTLSSAQTLWMKCVFPVIWIGGFTIGTVAMFLAGDGLLDGSGRPEPPETTWMFALATVVGSAFIYWFGIRLKRVSIAGDSLIISNYIKEITVPLRELEEVTENRWINLHPVTLSFRSETAFGRRMIFMPKIRWFAFFSSHPVVDELRAAARLPIRDDH